MFNIILQYPDDSYLEDDYSETSILTDAVPADGVTFVDSAGNILKVDFTSWEERDEGYLTPVVCLRQFTDEDIRL